MISTMLRTGVASTSAGAQFDVLILGPWEQPSMNVTN